MTNFYTLTTNLGNALLANAIALGQTIELSSMAIGDGNGVVPTPVQTQTELVNEVYRGSINSIEVDPENPNYLVVEMIVPTDVGGWTVREVGIYTDDGVLFAVGNFPEAYKPVLEEGSGRDLRIRLIIEVSSTSAVELKVDPAVVLASRDWVSKNYSFAAQVPGGSAGQVLTKSSDADGDVRWFDYDYLKIGTAIPLTTTTVPANCMLPDRSLALFSDYPRFYKKYLNGGFEGFVLPADSSEDTIAQYPGKFVLSLDGDGNPNGLYLPDLDGLFPRYGTSGDGSRNGAGLPNITGSFDESISGYYDNDKFVATGAFLTPTRGQFNGARSHETPSSTVKHFDASASSPIYGNSDTVMVDSFNQPIAIYLG